MRRSGRQPPGRVAPATAGALLRAYFKWPAKAMLALGTTGREAAPNQGPLEGYTGKHLRAQGLGSTVVSELQAAS